jgi:PadR family transcriptional regulator, regulatory protein PadR
MARTLREAPAEGLSQEFRRGALALAVLSALREEEYGYSLKHALAERGLDIDEGTLYPLLRRLEGQGLLKSRWRVEEGRPRRYYQISARGEDARRDMAAEWYDLARVMDHLLR